jgi:hypothetical protein
MNTQRPGQTGNKALQKPSAPGAPKPKKKLQLDVNDVDSVLERKISP